MIPMQVFDMESTLPGQILWWLKLLYWSSDIAFCFNTGYYSGEGKLVLRRKLVFMHYLRGWLFFDCLLVGMDWATVIQTLISGEGNGVGENAGAARAGKLA